MWACIALQINDSTATDEDDNQEEADKPVDITSEEAISLLQVDLEDEVIAELMQSATQADLEMQGVLA